MSRSFLKNMFGTKPKNLIGKRNDEKFKSEQEEIKSKLELKQKHIDDLNNIFIPAKTFYKKVNCESGKKESEKALVSILRNKGNAYFNRNLQKEVE